MQEIVVTYRTLERIAYWIVILVLAGLLLFAFLRDCGDSSSTTTGSTEDETAGTPEAPETEVPAVAEPEPAAPPEESCTDGRENQDETDVDCGGDCPKCAVGKSCIMNTDCASGRCESRVCTAAPTLSGEVTASIKSVTYTGGVNTSAKVTGIELGVTNGLAAEHTFQVEMYLKSANGGSYLNQLEEDELDGNYKPFASFELPALEPGEILKTTKFDLTGKYTSGSFIQAKSGRYKTGDDFTVDIVILDESGKEVATATKKVTV